MKIPKTLNIQKISKKKKDRREHENMVGINSHNEQPEN